MPIPTRKPLNLTLKLAILASGRTQRQIARETGIDETRLSRIIRQDVRPWREEVDALVLALKRSRRTLFADRAAIKDRRRIA